MQVATLFRESATLLGASMEAGGVGVGGTASINNINGNGTTTGIHDGSANTITNPGLALALDTYNHPNSNKYKLNMKLEPQDDGYETSADLMLSNTTSHNDSIKCESLEDPYSFIDEDPMPVLSNQGQGLTHCVPSITTVPHPHSHPHTHPHTHPHQHPHVTTLPAPKKRGRKKKIKNEPGCEYDLEAMNGNMNMNVGMPRKIKERKKHDRFNGMPEEEVSKRTLPDHLATNLDIIIIGINPGLFAAYKGHHYAGPGNHFWKCLYLSGLTPEQMTADEDYKLLQVGIGFTNMVQRPTKGSADLTRKEIKEGCQILLEKLQRFKPKIAVFNGKLIYEVFSGKKDFSFGRQPDLVDGTNTYMWVMPSSSARCAQLPRAADKVPFYAALKKFRDYLNGIVTSIDDSEVVFSDTRLKNCCESESKAESLYSSMDLMDISNAVVKRGDEVIPCKKKRGRPKKIKVEGEETKPVVRKSAQTQNHLNNCDFPKKKRGRPKKIKCEDAEVPLQERNTQTPISKCFSSPSPIQSPTSFCHMNTSQMTPPNSVSSNGGAGGIYPTSLGSGAATTGNATPMSLTATQQQQHTNQQLPYSQSPRPHSQPFTHSDLSSEISAAISSDHLGSPAPTSPSLGPPDFDPPTSMPTDDTTECRFSSPAPSTASEQPPPVAISTPYPSYHTFGSGLDVVDPHVHRFGMAPVRPSSVSDYKVQDMSSKSLSGLESLVDQIPSIAEGESPVTHTHAGLALPDSNDQYGAAATAVYPPSNYHHPLSRPGATSPGPGSSPVPQAPPPYNSYNSYGSLSVASLTGSSPPNSYNYGHSSPGNAPPPAPAPWMSGSHSFIDHHGCGVPPQMLPYAQLSPYGPPPGPGQQFSNVYPPPPTTPGGLHIPSPNYPPAYYNSSYATAPQTPTGPHSPGPGGYLHPHAHAHPHMFDRIKSDIGYGSF